LGIIGITGGFFYSSRPLRWVTRGWGELWIALCYGWLPVATAYYLLAGRVATAIHWVALPIALTIFNVILLNEFPDYDADLAAGKRNLTVRLGRARAAATYALTAVGSWVGLVLSLWNGAPTRALWFSLPFLLLSALLVMLMLQGRWRERQSLDRLCAANLAVNLGTSAAYVLALIVR
jgi:1,4-dihydroxy-2-naphthoate octaprenyltransferase